MDTQAHKSFGFDADPAPRPASTGRPSGSRVRGLASLGGLFSNNKPTNGVKCAYPRGKCNRVPRKGDYCNLHACQTCDRFKPSKYPSCNQCAGFGTNLIKIDAGRHPLLADFDIDGDGQLNADEVEEVIAKLTKEQKLVNKLFWGISITMALLAFSILANFGTSYAAYTMAKDTRVDSDNVMTTTDGNPVRTDSNLFSINESYASNPLGVASSAGNSSNSSANLFESGNSGPVLVDRTTGQPLRMAVRETARDHASVTSELPDQAFNELELLDVVGPRGSIHFKTLGWARYQAADSRCGSVVVVYTGMGNVQFDGTAMTFNEQVAGAFSRAGFVVSSRRRRRSDLERRDVQEDNDFTLVGVTQVIGEFRYVENLDMSDLSCGEERPSVKLPFVDATTIETLEHNLFICGTAEAGPCPSNADIATDSHGNTYFKRVTHTKAEKHQGNWYSIRSTEIPELTGQFMGAKFVEISNGTHGFTYQVVPGSPATHCTAATFAESAANVTSGFDSTAADAASPVVQFVGYDVFNGHYVRHFKLLSNDTRDAYPDGIDYFESVEEQRMYGIGLMAPDAWNLYETISTNADVNPDALQGDGIYPNSFASHAFDFDAIISDITATGCDDYHYIDEWALADAFNETSNLTAAYAEAVEAASTPVLSRYLVEPFVELDFVAQKEAAVALIDSEMLKLDEDYLDGDDNTTANGGGRIRERRWWWSSSCRYHSSCSSSKYCDTRYKCDGCSNCHKYRDAYNGRCPSKCSQGSTSSGRRSCKSASRTLAYSPRVQTSGTICSFPPSGTVRLSASGSKSWYSGRLTLSLSGSISGSLSTSRISVSGSLSGRATWRGYGAWITVRGTFSRRWSSASLEVEGEVGVGSGRIYGEVGVEVEWRGSNVAAIQARMPVPSAGYITARGCAWGFCTYRYRIGLG